MFRFQFSGERKKQAARPDLAAARVVTERLRESGEDLKDFCRRLTIRDREGKHRRFVWNRVQEQYWREREQGRLILVLKHRRPGISTVEMADSYRTFRRPHTQQLFLAHTGNETRRIFSMVHRFWRFDRNAPKLKSAAPGSTQMECPASGSSFYARTAGGLGAGRGDTLDKFHCSEASRFPGTLASVENLMAGLIEAASPHGKGVIETTPAGADEQQWFYRTWNEPRNWHKIFLAWMTDPANSLPLRKRQLDEVMDTLTAHEAALIRQHALTAGQIAWRRQKAGDLGETLFLQEYPEDPATCFVEPGLVLFDPLAIQTLADEALPPIRSASNSTETWAEFSAPAHGEAYSIGADVAKGLAGGKGDWCGWSVRASTGKQTAAGRCKDTPEEFGRRLAALSRRWNNATLSIESNNHGRSAIREIAAAGLQGRLACDVSWHGTTWKDVRNEQGITMTEPLRNYMLSRMKTGVQEGTVQVSSIEQIAEMRSIQRVRGSRYEGVPHDDIMFADMHCLFALERGLIRRAGAAVVPVIEERPAWHR